MNYIEGMCVPSMYHTLSPVRPRSNTSSWHPHKAHNCMQTIPEWKIGIPFKYCRLASRMKYPLGLRTLHWNIYRVKKEANGISTPVVGNTFAKLKELYPRKIRSSQPGKPFRGKKHRRGASSFATNRSRRGRWGGGGEARWNAILPPRRQKSYNDSTSPFKMYTSTEVALDTYSTVFIMLTLVVNFFTV